MTVRFAIWEQITVVASLPPPRAVSTARNRVHHAPAHRQTPPHPTT
jgi:hypothetical protein